MILLIDNYDSFVFNLARYFQQLGQGTRVVRNDAMDAAGVEALKPDAIVLSPGPCGPTEAGNSLRIVEAAKQSIPLLGICLGHQTIAEAFGAKIVRTSPVHGRTSSVVHSGDSVLTGIQSPFDACRYHSLAVDEATLPAEIGVTARTSDDVVMAIAHETLPIVGVQFHPESILTKPGFRILANFLQIAGISIPNDCPGYGRELRPCRREADKLPDVPVTF